MFMMNRRPTALFACLALAAAVLLGGCSQDKHVYRSTTLQPKAVSIVSFVSGEELWSLNVPPGQQLRLDFSRKGKGFEWAGSPDIPADKVEWELYSLDSNPAWGGARMKGGKKLNSGIQELPGEQVGIVVTLLDQEDPTLSAAQ